MSISAPRDANRIPVLIGTSSSDGTTPVLVYADPTTNRLLVNIAGGLSAAITSLNGLTSATQSFTNDSNVTITSSGSSHVIGWSGQLPLSRGGTANNLTASNGGIVYSTASSLAILSGTSTPDLILLSGSSAAPIWSTTTFPSGSINANSILYASSTSAIAALASANNGVLITSSSAVPSISSTLPSAVQGNITSLGTIASGVWNGSVLSPVYGGTGVANNAASLLAISGNFASTFAVTAATNVTLPTTGTLSTLAGTETLTNKTLTTPKIGAIFDSNGSTWVVNTPTASAVNYVNVTNAATGTSPIIAPKGETNVDLKLAGIGTGEIHHTSGSYGDITADTFGTTTTFDASVSNIHSVTLTGNSTFAITNDKKGQTLMFRVLQDATGSRTVTWWSGIKWAGGSPPTLTTTANKADMLGILVTTAGSAYDGFVVGANL